VIRLGVSSSVAVRNLWKAFFSSLSDAACDEELPMEMLLLKDFESSMECFW